MGIPRGPDDLGPDERARIRYQVLSSLRGRAPTLAERAYDVLALIALPAPHLVRAVVAATFLFVIAATAGVASADAVPGDPLYGFKLAGEDARLALALSATDRAAVELSIAEHRLDEAERLALDGREVDSMVATSAYSTHVANAAAALATVEDVDPAAAPIVDQLGEQVTAQRQRASDVAAQLAADPERPAAPAFRTIAAVEPGGTGAVTAQIAERAAQAADRIARQAENAVPTPSARPTARHSLPPAIDPQIARTGAERARAEAGKAREAADKAREATKKTPAPTATPHR